MRQSVAPSAHGTAIDSFYHLAGVELAGRHCAGTACFVARQLQPARWEAALGEHPAVHCLGKCYLAPAAAGDDARPHMEVQAREGIVLRHLGAGADHDYHALEAALRETPGQVLAAIDESGLRGRGGAGFPTGRKWRAAEAATSAEKFVIANADEGDPGAYIDRFLLEENPHALIEGMMLAGFAIGARRGWIYLRKEYPVAEAALRRALAEARVSGCLGERVLGSGFSFEIDIFIGQGSYVCGEETALLNSIEGRRPVAMARPPFATEHGLFGQPTVINNVETLVNVPWIVGRGAAAYRALGSGSSRGTKVVSLNSLFRRPGLYEVEFGLPVREIIERLGGGLRSGTLAGVMIGGPLAGVIPARLLDTPFTFDDLHAIGASVGHGGVIAFDEHTSIAQLVHQVFGFGADESCGKCVPCRLGSRAIERMFAGAAAGNPIASDGPSFDEMVEALRLTSLCGLGGGLAEFASSIQRHFPKELRACFA